MKKTISKAALDYEVQEKCQNIINILSIIKRHRRILLSFKTLPELAF